MKGSCHQETDHHRQTVITVKEIFFPQKNFFFQFLRILPILASKKLIFERKISYLENNIEVR